MVGSWSLLIDNIGATGDDFNNESKLKED